MVWLASWSILPTTFLWDGVGLTDTKKEWKEAGGASAECVSEHKLSQRQTNNNPGMQRTAQRSQGKNEHRAEWGGGTGITEEARLE